MERFLEITVKATSHDQERMTMSRLLTMLFLFALLCTFFFPVCPGWAEQDTGNEPAKYLTLAATNNNELKSAFEAWRAAEFRAPQVTSLPDPRLSFGYFVQPVETRTGPQRLKYGISQTFPLGGKLASKGRIAGHEAEILRAQAEVLKLRIFRDVTRAWTEYAYLGRALAVTEERMELLRYLNEGIQAGYTSGKNPYTSLIRAQMALDRTREQMRSLKGLIPSLTARLNALMGRSLTAPIPLPDSIPDIQSAWTPDRLRALVMDANPRIAALDFRVQGATEALDLAKRQYYPDLTVGIESIITDSSRGQNITNDGRDPVILTMGINLPIWQGRRNAAEEEAKAKIRSAHRRRAGQNEILAADLELALYAYQDAERKLDLYEQALIPKADQTTEVMLEAFQTGRVSFTELMEAETTRYELHLERERALKTRRLSLADMEFSIGREIPTTRRHPDGTDILSGEISIPGTRADRALPVTHPAQKSRK